MSCRLFPHTGTCCDSPLKEKLLCPAQGEQAKQLQSGAASATEPLACLGSVVQQGRVGHIAQINRPPEESVSWACPASQLLIPQSGENGTVPSPFWAVRMRAFPLCLMLWATVNCIHYYADRQIVVSYLYFFFTAGVDRNTLIYLICASHTFK